MYHPHTPPPPTPPLVLELSLEVTDVTVSGVTLDIKHIWVFFIVYLEGVGGHLLLKSFGQSGLV